MRSAGRFAERTFQKIILQRQLSDLGMKRLQIHRHSLAARRTGAEHPRSALQQLHFPGRDLVRMNVKKLRQLGQRLLALEGGLQWMRFVDNQRLPA